MPATLPIRSNRLFDLAAAAIPGGAAAYSANRLAPLFDQSPSIAVPLAGLIAFAFGLAVMRAASRQVRPVATSYVFSTDSAFSSELLLDSMWEEAIAGDQILHLDQPVDEHIHALAELMLDDPLPPPEPDSRVVQLFAAKPSAGELVNRIERHLGRSAPAGLRGPADATDALRRALEELRRSLRQA